MTAACTTFIGFDYGEQRIGVAIGQLLTRQASPCTTLTAVNNQPDWQRIGKLIQQWQATTAVVGVPQHMDGSDTLIGTKARRFARQIEGRFKLTVYHADERLSTVAANEFIIAARQAGKRGKTRKGDDDKIAAAIILQNWLAHYDTKN